MIRRYPYKKYLLACAALFLLMSLPALFVETFRAKIIGMFSPMWKGTSHLLRKNTKESDRLEGENHLLRIEIGKLRTLLEQQAKVEGLQRELPNRYEEINYLLKLQNQAVPGSVIYRDPGSWSSSIWVNVGEETNKTLHRKVIQKNSPVILGRNIVGAVDYVGKKQSRIRLITDVALKPSVRAVRGFPQNVFLIEQIDPLLRHLSASHDLSLNAEERRVLTRLLEEWKRKLSNDSEGWYLAKGILQGAGTPVWRSVNHTLRGIGFNYDFPDKEGPAREILSGKPIGGNNDYPAMPLLMVNDLLVTTGLDGVFPPGLRVAEVTKVYPLREGAYTFEIEAVPIVSNLDTLQTVFIIPPTGYDEDDQPE